jgi:hypothetical protein
MPYAWQMMRWAALALAMVTGIALGTVGAARIGLTSLERPWPEEKRRDASLSGHLSAIDAAIADRDRSRAVYTWRDAYGVALRSREWEVLVAMGDAALRIDALAGQPTAFRAEARQAYLLALFRARDAGAPEGVTRVAEAFAALGDAEMAARARSIQVKAAR